MTARDAKCSTKDKLMDAAQELMLSKGYVAASVGEICLEAGVTKGSFFHYFDRKESLGKALLQRFTERQSACFTEGCSGIEDPLQRVFALVDAMITASRNPDFKGCLVGVLAQEISETHPELRKICEEAFSQFALGVARDLQEAKTRHLPREDFDPTSMGIMLLALAQGSMLLIKANGNRSLLEANLSHFRRYLECFFGNEQHGSLR